MCVVTTKEQENKGGGGGAYLCVEGIVWHALAVALRCGGEATGGAFLALVRVRHGRLVLVDWTWGAGALLLAGGALVAVRADAACGVFVCTFPRGTRDEGEAVVELDLHCF